MISATMSTESTRKELIQMLMRTDPFRDLDRLTEAMFGTTGRPAVMPMDAYRQGDTFHIDLDLPGVDPTPST